MRLGAGAPGVGRDSSTLARHCFSSDFIPPLSPWYTDVERQPMAKVIIKDPDILGGEPVFRGTRVPFKVLIDYLEGGDTLDQFLEQYPSVTREIAIAAIEEARLSLVSQLQ